MLFDIMEELITKVGEFPMEGKNWLKQARVVEETRLRKFFKTNEELTHKHGGLSKEDLPVSWDVVCYAIMRYITL